jgi:uncharacterized OsmC-like protein
VFLAAVFGCVALHFRKCAAGEQSGFVLGQITDIWVGVRSGRNTSDQVREWTFSD